MDLETRLLIDLWVVFIVMGVLSFFAIAGAIVVVIKDIKDSCKKWSLYYSEEEALSIVKKKTLFGVLTFITIVGAPIACFYFKMIFTGIVTMVIIIALWVIFYDNYQFEN